MLLSHEMENELFQRKIKKLQVMLDEVEAQISAVQKAQEEIQASLKPRVSLTVLHGESEVGTEPSDKPDLMVVYPLA